MLSSNIYKKQIADVIFLSAKDVKPFCKWMEFTDDFEYTSDGKRNDEIRCRYYIDIQYTSIG